MDKNIEINKQELVKQISEIASKKEHIKAEFIVVKGETNPICNLTLDGVGPKEVGSLYLALEGIKKHIEKEYPTAVEFANKFLGLKGSTRIDLEN